MVHVLIKNNPNNEELLNIYFVCDFDLCEGKLIIYYFYIIIKIIMFPGMKIQYYITTM